MLGLTKGKHVGVGKSGCLACVTDPAWKVPEEACCEGGIDRARRFADGSVEGYGACRAVCESAGDMRTVTFEAFEGRGVSILPANPPGTTCCP